MRSLRQGHERRLALTEWLCGYVRAKYGDAAHVVKNNKGVELVSEDADTVAKLEILIKSLPKEIIASIGNIFAIVPRTRR